MIASPIQSETISPDELADITGSRTARGQLEWLDANGWPHHKNRAGAPIARLRLAGITPQAANAQAWAPDFSTIRNG